jgi:hypothetical protein
MNKLKPLTALVLVVSIILIVIINTPWAKPDTWLWGAFPATAGLMLLAILMVGDALSGRLTGLIIDNRNRMSLSKLQMLVWTIVVVSALVVYAAYNVRLQVAAPLDLTIPPPLLFAMGIAATSFIATPAILSLKSQQTPAQADMDTANAAAGTLQNTGKVYGSASLGDASWTDLFQGDEVGNFDSPDLSKIQQVAITLLLVGIYSAQIINQFAGLTTPGHKLDTLPVLGQQFVVLMGISHASYLAYKAAPHTATGDPNAAPTPTVVAPPAAPDAPPPAGNGP